ncbi:MAG: hypothetical protein GXO24_05415 [Chlorobi bacterium]|nr:hypothetical protein [Chlorobiota bacterium]
MIRHKFYKLLIIIFLFFGCDSENSTKKTFETTSHYLQQSISFSKEKSGPILHLHLYEMANSLKNSGHLQDSRYILNLLKKDTICLVPIGDMKYIVKAEKPVLLKKPFQADRKTCLILTNVQIKPDYTEYNLIRQWNYDTLGKIIKAGHGWHVKQLGSKWEINFFEI